MTKTSTLGHYNKRSFCANANSIKWIGNTSIEEIEDMSKSEKRALQSFLETLLMHLLKWQYQPAYQGNSWKFTIIEQRERILEHLQENLGLKSKLSELIARAYGYSVKGAMRETGLPISYFPESCPWAFETFMDEAF